jgi:hypothetical protein
LKNDFRTFLNFVNYFLSLNISLSNRRTNVSRFSISAVVYFPYKPNTKNNSLKKIFYVNADGALGLGGEKTIRIHRPASTIYMTRNDGS